jgi:hypothetical protein
LTARSKPSTLLTSPLSMYDFLMRLAFFAFAPVAIVFAANLFPIRGTLIDVGLALGVFVASEMAQRWSSKSRLVGTLLHEALAFEAYYRSRNPRPFLYYLFYPLLFPYWLLNASARREFLVFRAYTSSGLLILVASLIWQYVEYWAPELTLRQYIPYVLLSFGVEILLAIALLMPIATTVVWYHSTFRRGRLQVLLFVALLATSYAMYRVANRRAPLVSYAARERVALRTNYSKPKAHRALLSAARAAYHKLNQLRDEVEGDGNVTGEPLDAAHAALESYFKSDEASAFSVWASPRSNPMVVVVYFEARRNRRPIWVSIRRDGAELRTPSQLPRGAFKAMRAISEEEDDWFVMWPDVIDLTGEAETKAGPQPASGHRHARPWTSAQPNTTSPPNATVDPNHADLPDVGTRPNTPSPPNATVDPNHADLPDVGARPNTPSQPDAPAQPRTPNQGKASEIPSAPNRPEEALPTAHSRDGALGSTP